MAQYTVNNGTVTFNLPDEGTVFRATGDTTGDAVYKVVNGKLETVASKSYTALTKFASGGKVYNPGDTIDGSPRDVQWLDPSYRGGAVAPTSAYDVYKTKYGQDASALPEYNMGDIQTVLSRNGGILPTAPITEKYDPSIQGIIDNGNPNKVDANGNFQAPPGTQPSNNALVTGPIDPKTGTVAAPKVSLSPGSSGEDVKALQAYLSTQINPKTGQPYLTNEQIATGPGIYGPQTTAAVKAWQENNGVDNSTGPGVWGPRTIAASQGGVGAGSLGAPSQTGINDPVDVGSGAGSIGGGSLNLPQATAPSTVATYTTSLTTEIANLKTQIQQEADKRSADYQSKIDELDKKEKEYQALQEGGMAGIKDTTYREIAEKRAAYDLEKQRFDENYNANQALVGELDTLLTQGNQVITQMQETTGLASIMQPRIAKTMTDIAARAGVIEAVMNARNGQMANAQNQLSTSLNAISSIYNDELSYYQSVVNFYGTLKNETAGKIETLSKDQKEYLDVKINMLSNDLNQLQATKANIEKALLDPDTATAYAMAGVTLTDSVETINRKLANYNYSQEVIDINNKMSGNGYSKTPIAGVQGITIYDTAGRATTWYKKAGEGDDFTLGTNQVRFDAAGNVIARGPSDSNGGSSTNDAKLSSADRQILIGSGFNSGEIDNIAKDVATYGIDRVLQGIDSEAQKTALRKVYGGAAPQFLTTDYFKTLFPTSKLEKEAKDAGYTKGGIFGIGASADTDAYLASLMTTVEQYRKAGYSDQEILKMMQ